MSVRNEVVERRVSSPLLYTDEISTASSAPQTDNEREETPYQLRDSALGVLEPGREGSSSEPCDEDSPIHEGG